VEPQITQDGHVKLTISHEKTSGSKDAMTCKDKFDSFLPFYVRLLAKISF
jgi:hypothetical protein